ncbi:MAG: hypothetical protein WD156_09775 [Acidimicrobiia bacterium]
MTPVARAVLVVTFLLAACNGSPSPTTTTPADAQVPPADAGPVTIVDTEIAAGTDGHRLVVEGTQPTPCHGLGWFVEPANGRVEVSVWSEPPPTGEVCAQVIEAFSIEIDLGAPDGGTEVVLNGQVVG